jgi:hypothetical protein
MLITKRDNPLRILLEGSSLKLAFIAAIYFFAFRPAPAVFASSTVVINEFVPDGNPEWVEFYNASASAEYLKTYYVDDDTSFTSDSESSSKKLLTNLITSNPLYPYIELTSSIFNNDKEDNVVLFDSSGNILDQYSYSIPPGKEISFGRNPDKTGTFFALASATKGSTNSSPQPSATPSPTPTISPTSTPRPTATATPVLANTSTPTSTPTSVLTSTGDNLQPQVLAEADENSESQPEVNLDIIDLTATAESEINSSPSPPPEKSGGRNLPVVIISAAGIILMLAGGLPLIWSELKKRPNRSQPIS